jgi:crotonobetainyl-CoA:carnitine CoA-transferase CaiB-like acyl-CoA transferase
VNYIDLSTAQACAMGTLAALLARERSGRGQLVEGALLRSALVHTNALLIEEAVTRRGRIPQGNRGITAAPVDAFRVTDGWIMVHVVGQAMFERWCALVGRTEWISEPRFASDESRGDHGAEISAAMAAWCATKDRESVLLALAKAKVPGAPVYTLKETLDDAHIAAANMLPRLDFPGIAEPVPIAPHPVRFSEPMTVPTKRAPLLGEDTDAILAELGFSSEAIAGLRRDKVV